VCEWDIIDFLYKERKAGQEKYFSPKEIYKSLNSSTEKSIRKQINNLFSYGYLEVETEEKWGLFSNGEKWKRNFRISKTHMAKYERMLEEAKE